MKALDPYRGIAPYGRPPKLDEDTAQTILEAVAAGNFYRTAAALAGISYETLRRWRNQGEKGEEPYAAFCAALRVAKGQSEVRHVRNITQAGDFGDWKASAWFLTRRWAGERWHEEHKHTHTGEIKQKHVILVDKLDRDDLTSPEKSDGGEEVTGEQGVRGVSPAPSPNGSDS